MNGHDPKSTHIRTLDIKFYRITKSLAIDVGPNAHANRSHCTGYIKHNMMYNSKQLQQPNPIHYPMHRRPQYCEVLETIYAWLMTLWLKRVHVKTWNRPRSCHWKRGFSPSKRSKMFDKQSKIRVPFNRRECWLQYQIVKNWAAFCRLFGLATTRTQRILVFQVGIRPKSHSTQRNSFGTLKTRSPSTETQHKERKTNLQ